VLKFKSRPTHPVYNVTSQIEWRVLVRFDAFRVMVSWCLTCLINVPVINL
jgi:hypothetical protein